MPKRPSCPSFFHKLFGNVKLQKGESFLTGDYAEVDLNKGISKLLPAPNIDNLNDNIKDILNPYFTTKKKGTRITFLPSNNIFSSIKFKDL